MDSNLNNTISNKDSNWIMLS